VPIGTSPPDPERESYFGNTTLILSDPWVMYGARTFLTETFLLVFVR
jgi:hypothetical protein